MDNATKKTLLQSDWYQAHTRLNLIPIFLLCSLQYALSCWALSWVLILGHIPLRHKLSISLCTHKDYSIWKSPNDTLVFYRPSYFSHYLRFCSNVLYIIFLPQLFLDLLWRRHSIWDPASFSLLINLGPGDLFQFSNNWTPLPFPILLEQYLHPPDSLFLSYRCLLETSKCNFLCHLVNPLHNFSSFL